MALSKDLTACLESANEPHCKYKDYAKHQGRKVNSTDIKIQESKLGTTTGVTHIGWMLLIDFKMTEI